MIGGFLELELASNASFHPEALALNTGRNCLVYLIQTKHIKKLHIPHYICDVVIDTVKALGVTVSLYVLNEDFTPQLNQYEGHDDEYVLYVNYYGYCEHVVESLIQKNVNLIVDNNHAFFSPPHAGIDTFYSPRKFFGVPDGGYLYTQAPMVELEQDESFNRFTHLLMRIDKGFEDSNEYYEENEKIIDNLPLKRMSQVTERLLKSIDYDDAKKKRLENMKLYQEALGEENLLPLDLSTPKPSHSYPFMVGDGESLRDKLFENGVYTLEYWRKILKRVDTNTFEYNLSQNILGLPVDQRYTKKDIEHVIAVIKKS